MPLQIRRGNGYGVESLRPAFKAVFHPTNTFKRNTALTAGETPYPIPPYAVNVEVIAGNNKLLHTLKIISRESAGIELMW